MAGQQDVRWSSKASIGARARRAATNGRFKPGDASALVIRWGMRSPAKAGTLSSYPPMTKRFPTSAAVNEALATKGVGPAIGQGWPIGWRQARRHGSWAQLDPLE